MNEIARRITVRCRRDFPDRPRPELKYYAYVGKHVPT